MTSPPTGHNNTGDTDGAHTTAASEPDTDGIDHDSGDGVGDGDGPPRRRRLLTLGSGGYLIVLAAVFSIGAAVWILLPAINSRGAIGDGHDPDTYGFDLSTFRGDRAQLTGGGIPKDGLLALVDPLVVRGDEVLDINRKIHGKFLVTGDRVIGVTLNGESRAYPLRVLNWHEVANDEVGGVPVAVTYNPLCDSVVVFDRRISIDGPDASPVDFGVSGLLYNSNLVLFDRRSPPPGEANHAASSNTVNAGARESLWCQLLGEAIAGPATGTGESGPEPPTRLSMLPADVTTWGQWLRDHPDTTVVRGKETLKDHYMRSPYGAYSISNQPRFPVAAFPPPGPLKPMSRVVIVNTTNSDGETRTVYAFDDIVARANGNGHWQTTQAGTPLTFTIGPTGETVTVASPSPTLTRYAYWFAWHALAPVDRVFGSED